MDFDMMLLFSCENTRIFITPPPENETASQNDHMGNCQNYGPFLGPYYNTA